MRVLCPALSFLFGATIGILALSKAKFLYICVPALLVLSLQNNRKGFLALVAIIMVVSPWIYRNYSSFDKVAISDRGKTVLAVRTILTSEPTGGERLCMVYAFTHPKLQRYLSLSSGLVMRIFPMAGYAKGQTERHVLIWAQLKSHALPLCTTRLYPTGLLESSIFIRPILRGN